MLNRGIVEKKGEKEEKKEKEKPPENEAKKRKPDEYERHFHLQCYEHKRMRCEDPHEILDWVQFSYERIRMWREDGSEERYLEGMIQ